ncbi:MAG: hypothetical protein KGM49_09135 [Sphingomonadales bacterium]|nr:hypothetical protein [Sphingomonadales bacterium]
MTDKKHSIHAGNTGDHFGNSIFIAGTRHTCRVEFGFKFWPLTRLPPGETR